MPAWGLYVHDGVIEAMKAKWKAIPQGRICYQLGYRWCRRKREGGWELSKRKES
jgi:hypothetical protein